ncbi:MAG: metalloregulator ArsR/SmtB family transcription factor [Pseudomonadota bacterium]
MNKSSLNTIFYALADPTRRGMLAQLSEGEANVRSLTKQYAISQPAISKHLRVLEQAGLVTRTKRGRESIVRVDPRPINEVTSWIERYAHFWQDQFDAVEHYLQDKAARRRKP